MPAGNAYFEMTESLSADGRTTFGVLLRRYRLARRLSQEALAERAKISSEAVSALERGARKAPQKQTLILLMDALELDRAAREELEGTVARPVRVLGLREAVREADVPPAHNLPRRLSSFVNRVVEIAELRTLLETQPLVTLLGAGGVGKTRIALQLGDLLGKRFPDGVWFVELARLTDASLVAAEIAAILDIRESPERPILDVVVGALRERRVLLVLDNCEHVIDAAAAASAAILENSRGASILATSREPLRISGEHVYRLSSFEAPAVGASLNAAAAMKFSAVALFTERSIAHEPAFSLTDGNAATIATLCRRLDGIPLALELAAAKIPVLSAVQIIERLDRRLTLLADGNRTTQPRQQTLRALIGWSFDLLSPIEQTLFRRAAIFGGSWTLEAAVTVCDGGELEADAILNALGSLIAKSLVQSDPSAAGGARFWFYETTREYAAEQLARAGERDELARKHATYVLAFAREALSLRPSVAEDVWLDRVARNLDDIRGALNWSLTAGNDIALGAEIATAAGFFWFSRRYAEGVEWLAKARGQIGALEPRIAANVYLESARIEPYGDGTLALAERAAAAYEAIDDADGLTESLTLVGQNLVNQGRFEAAEPVLRRGIVFAQRVGDDVMRAKILGLLGFSRIYALDAVPARKYFAEAIQVAQTAGSDREHAIALRGLAEIALLEDEWNVAIDACRSAVEALDAIGDIRRATEARCHLAQSYVAAGRMELARSTVLTTVVELGTMHLPLVFLHAVIVLAAIFSAEHDDGRAAQALGFVQARARKLPYRQLISTQRMFDRTTATLRERLGASASERMARGTLLSDDQLRMLLREGSAL